MVVKLKGIELKKNVSRNPKNTILKKILEKAVVALTTEQEKKGGLKKFVKFIINNLFRFQRHHKMKLN